MNALDTLTSAADIVKVLMINEVEGEKEGRLTRSMDNDKVLIYAQARINGRDG